MRHRIKDEYADYSSIAYHQTRLIDLTKRLNDLHPVVEGIKSDPLFPRHENALELYDRLQDGILPYNVGWMELPASYHSDIRSLELLYEYESLPARIARTQQRIKELLTDGTR